MVAQLLADGKIFKEDNWQKERERENASTLHDRSACPPTHITRGKFCFVCSSPPRRPKLPGVPWRALRCVSSVLTIIPLAARRSRGMRSRPRSGRGPGPRPGGQGQSRNQRQDQGKARVKVKVKVRANVRAKVMASVRAEVRSKPGVEPGPRLERRSRPRPRPRSRPGPK